MTSNIILPNVTLAAIVRDERINPAGGIEDFIECTMPFVGAGVVVDTGSLDGTREALERAKERYSQLRIYDHEFKGFADARNHSLQQVQTPFVLILDADERLSQEDFEELRELVQENPNSTGFSISISDIHLGDTALKSDWYIPRLFRTDKNLYYYNILNNFAEFLEIKNNKLANTEVYIKHFKPLRSGIAAKHLVWYELVKTSGKIPAPSQTEGFPEWKQFNPRRLNYHFGLPDYQFKVPELVQEGK